MEDSTGVIDQSLMQTIDISEKGLKTFKASKIEFILNLKCATLDDLIEALSDKNFIATFNEATNILLLNIEIEIVNEHDNLDYIRKNKFNDLLTNDRVIIVQMCDEIWIKSKGKNILEEFKEFPNVLNFFADLQCDKKILDAKLKFSTAMKFISYNDEIIINFLKLFKFNNQDEVDKKLFEEVAEKGNFETFQLMMKFHSDDSKRIKSHEIYAHLLSKGHKIFKDQLTEDEKEKITDAMAKYCCNENSLIQFVSSRSQIAMCSKENEGKYWRKIQLYYEYLNGFVDIQPILQLVDKNLRIIFDFNSDSIELSYPVGSQSDKGVFDSKRMQITIGAKNDENCEDEKFNARDFEIAGILIHELCHHAMQKLFNNKCRPYNFGDVKKEAKFSKIIEIYERKSEKFHDDIVKRVFNNYGKEKYAAEMIVRVPQMIANYSENQKHLNDMKENYKELFEYFNEFILLFAKDFLDPESQLRRKIADLSILNLDNVKLFPASEKLNYNPQKSVHVIASKFPEMTIWQLQQQLDKSFTIFTTSSDFEKRRNQILLLIQKFEKVHLVINCEKNFQFDNLEAYKEALQKVFLISQETSSILKALKINKLNHEEFGVDYLFSDLSEASKTKILKSPIKFQGHDLELGNVVDKNSKILANIRLEELTAKKIKIGREIEINEGYNEKYFIERTLSYKDSKCSEELQEKTDQEKSISTDKIEEIRELMSEFKLLLISDHSGQGKSTVLTHLALKLQIVEKSDDFFGFDDEVSDIEWIVKINLHIYVDVFKKIKLETMSEEDLEDFIYTNFVEKSKNEFEKNVFKEFVKNKRVIFILDGFDEIAPFCDGKVKEFIKKIFNSKALNIFVTTRPYLENDFKEFNGDYVQLNLIPFTIQNQIDFTVEFLSSKSEINEKISDILLKDFVTKIVEGFTSTLNDTNVNLTMLSTPLHTYMMACVLCEKIDEKDYDLNAVVDDEEIYNFYTLYKEFLKLKKIITMREKGKNVTEELVCDDENVQLDKAYKKLAFNTIFTPEIELDLYDKELSLMLRYGIVSQQNKKFHFIHRSFAEFYVAESILKSIIKGNISNTVYGKNNLLIQIFVIPAFETVRTFIDAALSKEEFLLKLTNENLKFLGSFLISEFKSIDEKSQWKNFLQVIVENEKGIIRRALPKIFIFLSHLCLSSLLKCENENEAIQQMLSLTWNDEFELFSLPFQKLSFPGNSKIEKRAWVRVDHSTGKIIYSETDKDIYFEKLKFQTNGSPIKDYGEMHGENLFHVVCRLNIKCLIMIVWEIAVKIFDEQELRNFFIAETFFAKRVFELSFESTCNHIEECNSLKNDSRFDSIYFKSIEDLRKTKRNEMIDFNTGENFVFSSTFELIEISKSLNLTEDEKLDWTKYSNILETNNFENYLKYVFFFLKIHLKIKKELFESKYHAKSFHLLNYLNNIYNTVMIGLTNPDNSEFIKEMFKFLKENLESMDYNFHLVYFFARAYETVFYINPNMREATSEKNALVLYKVLKLSFNENELENVFTFSPSFICIRTYDSFDINFLKNAITLYCKVLDTKHLKLLMLNRAGYDRFVLNRILSISRKVAEHTLESLKTKFQIEESLLTIVLNMFWPNLNF